jgi:hypothetical protein
MQQSSVQRMSSAEVLLPAIAKVLNDTAACGLRRRATDAAERGLVSQLIDREWLICEHDRLRLTREGEAERPRLMRQLRQSSRSARSSFTGSAF